MKIGEDRGKFKLVEVSKNELIEKGFDFLAYLLNLDVSDDTKKEIGRLLNREYILKELRNGNV